VNPIEVWEGIDTHEEYSHNQLTKLAIHVLSIIANSAGCEHTFSHMGLIHTGIRSKLGVEKVCKTTIVGMDIKWMHLEASLLPTRGKQHFTSQPGAGEQEQEPGSNLVAGDLNVSDSDDLLDFNQLSECLITSAAAANGDRDVGNDIEDDTMPSTTASPLMITIPPLHSAALSDQACNRPY